MFRKESMVLAVLAFLALFCGTAFAQPIESADAQAGLGLHLDAGGVFTASTDASAANLGGLNLAGASTEIYTATPGNVGYTETASTEQNGGCIQIADVSNTAVALAGKSISGYQEGTTSQVGAEHSSATGSDIAVLGAKRDISSGQYLGMSGYGSDTANFDASTVLIADSQCGNVFGNADINLWVDPAHIGAKESTFMNVAAGKNAYLDENIFAWEGATKSITNDADNEMIVKTGRDAFLNQGISVTQRLWGNDNHALAVNTANNKLNAKIGDDLNANLNAFGLTTTGSKATVFMDSNNAASGTVHDDAFVNEHAGAVHYIV